MNISRIIENLYLGSYIVPSSRQLLHSYGISAIVQVMEEMKPKFEDEFEYLIIPIDDSPTERIKDVFDITYDFISRYLGNNKKVLVHCAAGISRSATIVTAYLMKEYKIGVYEALKFVQSQRQIVNPNRGFLDQLIEYQAELIPIR